MNATYESARPRRMPVRQAAATLVAMVACVAGAPAASAQRDAGVRAADAATTTDRIATEVRTRSDRGFVMCAIFNRAAARDYPTHPERALAAVRVAIADRRAACNFDVPPAEYAVAAYHDENANGRLDTGFLGIPLEGFGASNDAVGTMGPPSFDAAKFVYRGNGIGTIRIALRY